MSISLAAVSTGALHAAFPAPRGEECAFVSEDAETASDLFRVRKRRVTEAPASPHSSADHSDLDRLIDHLHRNAHDPDAVRSAAATLRRTVETSLLESARQAHGKLPAIHAAVLGKATALFIETQLRSLVHVTREMLILLSSPRRLCWALKAAWRGDEIRAYVHERAEFHSVDEIAVLYSGTKAPVVRVTPGGGDAPEPWLNGGPTLGISAPYFTDERSIAGMDADDFAVMPRQTLFVVGEHCEIAARVTGTAPLALRERLQELCEAAGKIIADNSAGGAERVFRIKQLAMPLLKKNEPEIARQFWHPLTLLTAVLVISATLLGSAGVEHLRWSRIVQLIDAEPGIEVISHDTAWGRRTVEVLRDPLARPISEVLTAMQCDPADIQINEHPFLCADDLIQQGRQQDQLHLARGEFATTKQASPAVTAASIIPSAAEIKSEVLSILRLDMARTALDLPPDIDLTLADGVLAAKGDIFEPAWSRLSRASEKMPWITRTDLSAARDLTAANIAKLRADIEKARIDFSPASSILTEASRIRLRSIASDLKLLASEAALKQQSLRILPCSSNSLLDPGIASQRAAVTIEELGRLGIPSAALDDVTEMPDAPGPHSVALRITLEPLSMQP